MADAITEQRLKELLEKYAKLKIDVLKVDDKYSLEYGEPQIDLPPSLNLEKIIYVPKTDDELAAAADLKISALYQAKQRQIYVSYLNKLQACDKKYADLNENLRQNQLKLLNEYNETCDKLRKSLVNNGLLYSSVNEKSSVKARGDYADKVAETNLRFENEKSAVDAEQTAAQNVYEQSLASIESERQSKLDDVLSDLRENEEKTRLNVEKYNNSLQEKEIKYQASREKALEAAREAEYDRAYKMAKLLAEIGETGIKEKVLLEKYHICQNSFRTLRRNEAKTLLNVDAFLQTNLEKYYTTFVDWINWALIE